MGSRYTLRRIGLDEIMYRRPVLEDPAIERTVRLIMEDVRLEGEPALARYASTLDGNDGRLWYYPDDFSAAIASLDSGVREAMERAAGRIRDFAKAQAGALRPVSMELPGGSAGHDVIPVERAGCYAPGGRFSLPSTVLMTALVARTAGVSEVAVASPRPTPEILAACALAGADMLLAAGGAQAIAAFAYGSGPLTSRDVIVGPGNRYVAAAKRLVQSVARTDAPAGPSELLVIADDGARPEVVAWDLLAQAEHDPDALACLACFSEEFASRVERALSQALVELRDASPTSADNAAAALGNSWIFVSALERELAQAANRFAPEHLALAVLDPRSILPMCKHAGALFLGYDSAEAFGDYGAGPNHTLPTAGRSRSSGGLSVFDFLRVRTWLRIDGCNDHDILGRDSAVLARIEGLEAHARSACVRAKGCKISELKNG